MLRYLKKIFYNSVTELRYTISVVDPDNKGAKLATIVLPFEFTQPELDITRVNGEKAIWTSETELRVYGDKVNVNGKDYMYAPLYEAFTTAYEKQFSAFVPGANYYMLNLKDKAIYDGLFMGTPWNGGASTPASLTNLDYSSTAEGWNTSINKLDVQNKTEIAIHAEYYFYGVYPATEEQVKDFTLRFSSLLGDAETVKANSEFTSTTVTREVVLTDKDFTLVDALGDQFYLFNGVKDDGNVIKRSELNSNQKFEEGTEGFEIDFTLASLASTNGIKVKDANGNEIDGIEIRKGNISPTDGTINEDGTVTVPTGSDVAFYVNSKTKTRGWAAQTATENSIIVTDLPAKQADKPNGYAAIPGGIMIQLPSSIGTTEPVTIEFELVDVFGVTKTLSVTVKAAK